MHRVSCSLVLMNAPTLAGAHTGDHSTMSFAAGLLHAVLEHWGWLCAAGLIAAVYAIGSTLKSASRRGTRDG